MALPNVPVKSNLKPRWLLFRALNIEPRTTSQGKKRKISTNTKLCKIGLTEATIMSATAIKRPFKIEIGLAW